MIYNALYSSSLWSLKESPQSGEQQGLNVRRGGQRQVNLVAGGSITMRRRGKGGSEFSVPRESYTHTHKHKHTGQQKQQMATGLFPLYPHPPPPPDGPLKLCLCLCHSSTVPGCLLTWSVLTYCYTSLSYALTVSAAVNCIKHVAATLTWPTAHLGELFLPSRKAV